MHVYFLYVLKTFLSIVHYIKLIVIKNDRMNTIVEDTYLFHFHLAVLFKDSLIFVTWYAD